MRKRVLALILALVMCLSLLPVGAFAAPLVDSGECGENLRWTLEDEGTLIISGNSEMTNYFLGNRAPWYKHRHTVKKIIVADGVKSIGNYAFDSCDNAVYVNIPDTVKSIGRYAFSYCSSLPSVTIPEKVESIGEKAFEYCGALTELNYNAKAVADLADDSDVFFQAGKSGEGISVVFGDTVEKIPAYFFPTNTLDDRPKIKSVTSGANIVSIGAYAFKNCSGIERLTIPEKVTSIGNGAFYNCVGLKELRYNAKAVADLADNADVFYNAGVAEPGMDVIFGGTVEKIPSNLFRTANENFHARINAVTMPASLKTVGEYAFRDTGVKSVKINDLAAWCGVNFGSYGSNPLYYAHDLYVNGNKLTELVIPDSVTAIGSHAFNGCSIKSVTVPASLKSIDEGAFDDCSDLERVDISDLAAWCGISFEYCDSNPLYYAGDLYLNGSKLTELVIPEGVTAVGNYTFAGCSMTSVTIPEGVTTIGTGAFEGCSDLCNVVIPQSLKSVKEDAFYWCSDLERVDISDLAAWCGISFESSSANPLSNMSSLYLDGNKLTEISIPDTVQSIGKYQFYHCGGLKKVMFPSSVNSIGNSAFSNCWSLESVRFEGNAPTSFGSSVFSGCASGFKILAPENDDTWKDPAHYGSVSQKWYGYRIEFIDPIIGSGECGDNLVWNVLLDGTLNISGTGDMWDYSSDNKAPWYEYRNMISSVNIGSGVTGIGNYAFYNCGGINNVSIGNSVLSIGSYAFCSCGAITSIKLPASLEIIADDAFRSCGITGIELPDSVVSIGSEAFCACRSLESVDLGSGIKTIGNSAFSLCTAITSVNIPDSVETIEGYAFQNCSALERVTIGKNIKTIGRLAFSQCGDLAVAEFCGNAPAALGAQAFSGCADGFKIIAPENDSWKGTAYKPEAKTWNGYPIEFDHTHVYTDVVTKPTCTEKGFTTHTCACGESYKDTYTDALGHDYGEWVTTKERTCTEKGEWQRTCARCGDTDTMEVSATGHSLWNGICTVCGYVDPDEHEHLFSVKENVNATCTTDGYTIYICKCGYSYKACDEPAYGHHFSGPYCEFCGAKNPNYVEKTKAPSVSITTTASTGKIKLSWAKVTGAEKYEVYRSTDNKSFKKLTTTTKTSYTNTSATAGTKYYYKVRGLNCDGIGGSYSKVVSKICDLAQPVVTLSNVSSSGKIKVSWDKVTDASKYEVYRATSSSGTYKKLTSTTSTSYTDTSASVGSKYYYKVKAICSKTSDGNSAYSSVASRICYLAQPVVTLSNVSSSGKIKVSWDKVTDATKYEVYRATSSSGTYKKLTSTTKTSYTDTSATAGTKYYYKVKAIAKNTDANSAYSSVKNLTCDLARPTVKITTSKGDPKLSWAKIDSATKYEVYRATSSSGTYKKLTTTTKVSYTDTSAKAGTTYYYKVKAVCSKTTSGNSAYSSVVSIKAK